MLKFDLNWARSNVGRRVNLHLKDGSVIVNVLITKALKAPAESESSALHYAIPIGNKNGKLFLREISWAERLDSQLFATDEDA